MHIGVTGQDIKPFGADIGDGLQAHLYLERMRLGQHGPTVCGQCRCAQHVCIAHMRLIAALGQGALQEHNHRPGRKIGPRLCLPIAGLAGLSKAGLQVGVECGGGGGIHPCRVIVLR